MVRILPKNKCHIYFKIFFSVKYPIHGEHEIDHIARQPPHEENSNMLGLYFHLSQVNQFLYRKINQVLIIEFNIKT